jgi:hypothetical protein
MALFNECMQSCAHIVLDTADIVRDGDILTTTFFVVATAPRLSLTCPRILLNIHSSMIA